MPVSIIGTFAVMYGLGFSLNNLSLMALTIATGFVVDDAVVMIENIARYIEAGDAPLEAALKGSAQIGFTILSLTVSLIAVLIPLLFMGDIVGRLFREFAITLSAAILVSAAVSLTLTPMLCAKLLRHQRGAQAGPRGPRLAGGRSTGSSPSTRARCAWCSITSPRPCWSRWRRSGSPCSSTWRCPRACSRSRTPGVILGISEAPQSISFPAMAQRQRALAQAILRDPAVDTLSSFIGIDGTNMTLNSGRILITLKPLERAGGRRRARSSTACARSWPR